MPQIAQLSQRFVRGSHVRRCRQTTQEREQPAAARVVTHFEEWACSLSQAHFVFGYREWLMVLVKPLRDVSLHGRSWSESYLPRDSK
jgi:hypothetical protein